jgi:uncharacterized Zn-finger protein
LKDKTAMDPRDGFDGDPSARKQSGTGNGRQDPLTRDTRPYEVPAFFNPNGVNSIEIGVSAFDCIGLSPPHDHPHVYLNIGERGDIQCPYCSTHYRLNPALGWNETIPPDCWVAGG